MKQEVKVSVIMLAYNIEKYIETAIRGVVGQQTSYAFELIIAEDHSSDGTLAICRRYAQRYPTVVRLIEHRENYGLQRNFMDAHRHCRGEYIAICDGDDYWTDAYKLQKMTNFMDTHPDFSTCFHRVINYYEQDGTKSLSNGGQAAVNELLDLCRANFITNSSSLFRRAYYPELPAWFAEITSCDYAMHLLNAGHGKIYYFKKPMGVYRKHSEGIWSIASEEKRFFAALRAREQVLAYYCNRPEVYAALVENYTLIAFNLLRHYRRTGQETEAAAMRKQLLTYRSEWTEADIIARVEALEHSPKRRLRDGLRKVLSWGRAQVSKCFPLPQVRF